MPHAARNTVLATLLTICASSVLASRRHPRHYSSNHHPSFVGGNKDYRAETNTNSLEYSTPNWPSKTDDCLASEVRLGPDALALYLHDGRLYDKNCLKTLVYLVEPEERAACRARNDCHYSRGYDNDCLIQLSFDRGFGFNFKEMRQQELEWKKSVCHGMTLDQCGRDHSSWWRNRFPSTRGDCRIRGRADEEMQGGASGSWVPWSVGPHGRLYDNDCLSRFANRLGMENPGNCTEINAYLIHEAREVPPVELPKTLVHAPDPSRIQPHLELPTSVADPAGINTTPLATYIPTPEDPITDIIPKPFTTGIPDRLGRKRSVIPPPSLRTLTKTTDALPTPLPLNSRAEGSTDQWSCMWHVDITLPDPAAGMFDATFGDATVGNVLLVAQEIGKGELEDLGGCGDVIRRNGK